MAEVKLKITPSIFLILLTLVVFVQAHPLTKSGDTPRLSTVVIDPGHGGMDPGAVAGGMQEKDLVLDLALRLGKKIKAQHPEVKIIYTRDKDIFIPLYARADIANRNKADLFISLHANYVSATSVSGTETFTLGLHRSEENLEVAKKENAVILLEENYSTNYEGFNPNETESYIMFENMQAEYQNQSLSLAANIQNQFSQRIKTANRGVKQAGFLVLRRATMPSVLVEVGFISNAVERRFLDTEAGKNTVVESILHAFSHYKKSIDERSNFTVSAAAGQSLPEEPVIAEVPADTGKNQPAPVTTSAPPAEWFGVQVSAGIKKLETTPGNFKNERQIQRFQVNKVYKYVAGRFETFAEANRERQRLEKKFPGAFVVKIDNNVPVAVKNR